MVSRKYKLDMNEEPNIHVPLKQVSVGNRREDINFPCILDNNGHPIIGLCNCIENTSTLALKKLKVVV